MCDLFGLGQLEKALVQKVEPKIEEIVKMRFKSERHDTQHNDIQHNNENAKHSIMAVLLCRVSQMSPLS